MSDPAFQQALPFVKGEGPCVVCGDAQLHLFAVLFGKVTFGAGKQGASDAFSAHYCFYLRKPVGQSQTDLKLPEVCKSGPVA